MEIDFSFIDGLESSPPAASSKPRDPYQGEADKNRQKINYALEAWSRYQEAIKRTEGLQNRIVKGMQAGEPLEDLFLKAIEALGLAVGDNGVLLQQAREILERRGGG